VPNIKDLHKLSRRSGWLYTTPLHVPKRRPLGRTPPSPRSGRFHDSGPPCSSKIAPGCPQARFDPDLLP
jgi:hypothetical protein